MFIKASHEANMSKEVNFGKIACRSPHRQLRFQSTLPPFSLIFLERRAVNKSVKYDLPPCYQNISTVQTIWLIAIQSQETINQMFCVPNEYFRNCTKMYSNYSPFFSFLNRWFLGLYTSGLFLLVPNFYKEISALGCFILARSAAY